MLTWPVSFDVLHYHEAVLKVTTSPKNHMLIVNSVVSNTMT